MRKIREVLRLHCNGMTVRKISQAVGISRYTVDEYIRRAAAAQLELPVHEAIDDEMLEKRLYPQAVDIKRQRKPEPDYGYIYNEMKRPGASLGVLHQEFLEIHPDAVGYSLFCSRFKEYRECLDPCLRKTYMGGEVVFVDFSGKKMKVFDQVNGVYLEAQIFVGVLGASSYTYAEAVWSQSIPNWIEAHINMFEFFGGVPHTVTPDNLKSAVIKAGISDPDINESYRAMASHYCTSIIPARPKEPKDKAKVEAGVRYVQLALFRLRNRCFTSLGELNAEILKILDTINDRPFQKRPGTRRSLFMEIDKPNLYSLPLERHEYTRFMKAMVNVDYHITVDKHEYSVPPSLINKTVEIRVTPRLVEVIWSNRRVASHPYSPEQYGRTTDPDHMPSKHRGYALWEPTGDLAAAGDIGTELHTFMYSVFSECKSHDSGYRQSVSFKKLLGDFSHELIEKAAKDANQIKLKPTVRTLRDILSKKLSVLPHANNDEIEATCSSENIRGPEYYK